MSQSAETYFTLLLGGSGFLGKELRRALSPSLVMSTYHRSPDGDSNSMHFHAGKTRIRDIVAALPSTPRAAVILFGITGIDACAHDPLGTAEVNVTATARVIEELRELGIAPIFVSSDAVFDGHRSWSRESDEARPVLTYGQQKLEVEKYIAALPPPWLVVRLPKLIAENCDPRCMLTAWIQALALEGEILCATDQYFTPAAATDVAQAIAELVRGSAHGLFHLGGPDRVSRRELLSMVVDEYVKFERVRARIVDCSLRDLPFAEARPLDTSLCSERASSVLRKKFRDAKTIAKSAVYACMLSRRGTAPHGSEG